MLSSRCHIIAASPVLRSSISSVCVSCLSETVLAASFADFLLSLFHKRVVELCLPYQRVVRVVRVNNRDNHNNRKSSSNNNYYYYKHNHYNHNNHSSNSNSIINNNNNLSLCLYGKEGVWKIVRASQPVVVVAWTLPFMLYLVFESDVAITNSMGDTFAVGVDGWVPSDETATVVRAAVMGDLLPILQPDHSKQYFVILGKKGVGKSTAVRQAIKQLEDPRGVIYIMAPSADSSAFVARLAETTKYHKAVDSWGRLRRYSADDRVSVSEVPVGVWPRLENKLLEVGKA